MQSKIRQIVFCSLFAALTCVLTVAVQIPVPGGMGYVHAGDAIVIISGIVLGGYLGAVAGGIGSALADIIGGYAVYAPFTFVIKGLVALLSAIIFNAVCKNKKNKILPVIMGGAVDVVVVSAGYFLCELLLFGSTVAAVSVPLNIVQGCGGLVIASVLYPVFASIPIFRRRGGGGK